MNKKIVCVGARKKKNTFLPPSFHPQPRKCAGLVNISGPVWLITVSWRSCGGWLVKAARWAPDMMLRWARNRTEFPHPRWATPPNSLPPYRLASPAHYRSSSFPRHINNRQAITCLLPLPGLCLEAEGSAASTVALLRWGEREEESDSGGETLQEENGVCCPSDPFGPESYKCLLTRSNRTVLRRGRHRGHTHWRIPLSGFSILSMALTPTSIFPFLFPLPFLWCIIQFFPLFSSAGSHPLQHTCSIH